MSIDLKDFDKPISEFDTVEKELDDYHLNNKSKFVELDNVIHIRNTRYVLCKLTSSKKDSPSYVKLLKKMSFCKRCVILYNFNEDENKIK